MNRNQLRQLHELEPLFAWDAGAEDWIKSPYTERCHWLMANGVYDLFRTYRVEFHLVDAPFAIVFRYVFDDGKRPQHEAPKIVMLDDLPPVNIR